MDNRMELAALACRRYPDVELPLAIRFFESDRRWAGLGALDERKRKGGEVSNYKRDVYEHRQVRYHLVRKTRDRWEYPRMRFEDFVPSIGDVAETTVQMVKVPGRDQHLCVPADYRDFREQSGRRMVAAMLRKARRQLRATEAKRSQGRCS